MFGWEFQIEQNQASHPNFQIRIKMPKSYDTAAIDLQIGCFICLPIGYAYSLLHIFLVEEKEEFCVPPFSHKIECYDWTTFVKKKCKLYPEVTLFEPNSLVKIATFANKQKKTKNEKRNKQQNKKQLPFCVSGTPFASNAYFSNTSTQHN